MNKKSKLLKDGPTTGDSRAIALLSKCGGAGIVRDHQSGWVFWITGLSGSGKTTLGRSVYQQLRTRHPNSVFLDGNLLREVFENDLGYSQEERRKCARRYCRLSRMLAEQGLHVVVATISMFDECRHWNRKYVKRYYEIYLRAPFATLASRDAQQLYRAAREGHVKEVVGVDLPFEEPANADLVIDTSSSRPPEALADWLWNRLSQLPGI